MTKAIETALELDRRRKYCKKWLIDKDMSQNEVAEKLNMSYQTISSFINGRLWSQNIADYFGYKRSN